MCTESLLGVSEAQAVPGRVRAPGTVQTARQVALHRVTGGSLPRRRRLFSEGSRDAAPGRASEARALSLCGFLPSGSLARPASPRSDSASSASATATVSSASLLAGAAVHSGKCPKAVGRAGAGAGITVLQDLFFNIQPPLFLFFPRWFSTGEPRPQHFEGGRKFPRPL